MKETSDEAKLNLLRELYPQLTEAELVEVKETLDRYLQVVESIMENLRNDPKLQAKYELLKAEYDALTGVNETDNLKAVEY